MTGATKHIEYARAVVAAERVKIAIAQLQSARAEISVTAGEQRAAVRFADEALLAAQRMHADILTITRALGR
jgi:hypothetical protein